MRTKLLIGIPLALAIAVVGGSWFYIKVLESDPPAHLTVDSGSSNTTIANAQDDGSSDGSWKVSSDSIVGYRVKETLFGASGEAVGRTSKVTGSIAISGTTVTSGSFTVDMTSVASDRTQRDGQFRSRIMNTSQFPTATFTLTSPIALSSVALNETVSATAVGDLTLHGVTKRVTFPVSAKRATGEVRANGTIPIHFSDYRINDPSGGPASVGDDGTLEFTLVFTR
ncbi:MAG: hypothetical protein QOJ00_2920 [Actinomycetota bacterium]|jgi:polyisoprenoid-binding protein YceI